LAHNDAARVPDVSGVVEKMRAAADQCRETDMSVMGKQLDAWIDELEEGKR
jgi:hypothetical protein